MVFQMSNKNLDKINNTGIITEIQSVSMSAPLPPPEWLEKYNNVNPEIVKEILNQYSKNSEYFREKNKKELNFIFLIQWLGFIILISILILIYFCIKYNRTGIAVALLGIGTASVFGIFMNRNSEQDNNK